MTYRELAKKIGQLPNNRLDDTVTIYDRQDDEYFGSVSLELAGNDQSVLDEQHPILKLVR